MGKTKENKKEATEEEINAILDEIIGLLKNTVDRVFSNSGFNLNEEEVNNVMAKVATRIVIKTLQN